METGQFTYRIAIQGISPDHRWIYKFLKDIRRRSSGKVRTKEIADFGRIYKRIMRHEKMFARHTEASEAYKAAEKSAEVVYLLLVHPKHYKHFLRSIAELQRKMASDPRTVLIYDFRGLEYEVTRRSPIELMDMVNVMWLLRDTFGESRVLERSAALDHAIRVLSSQRRQFATPSQRIPSSGRLPFLCRLWSSFQSV
jgi:hypothetical protein